MSGVSQKLWCTAFLCKYLPKVKGCPSTLCMFLIGVIVIKTSTRQSNYTNMYLFSWFVHILVNSKYCNCNFVRLSFFRCPLLFMTQPLRIEILQNEWLFQNFAPLFPSTVFPPLAHLHIFHWLIVSQIVCDRLIGQNWHTIDYAVSILTSYAPPPPPSK